MTNDEFEWDEEDFRRRYEQVKNYVFTNTPLNNAAVTNYETAKAGLSSKLGAYEKDLKDLGNKLTSIGNNKADKGNETKALGAVVDDLSKKIAAKADKLTYKREGYEKEVKDTDPIAELNAILKKIKPKNKHFSIKANDLGLTGFAPSAKVLSVSATVVDFGVSAFSFSLTGTKIGVTGFSATFELLKASKTECLAEKLRAVDTEVALAKKSALIRFDKATASQNGLSAVKNARSTLSSEINAMKIILK